MSWDGTEHDNPLDHYGLPAGAKPQQWVALIRRISMHRRMQCEHYSACLTYTARQDWEGWTCSFCPFANPQEERIYET
jgi:hypothetical protein